MLMVVLLLRVGCSLLKRATEVPDLTLAALIYRSVVQVTILGHTQKGLRPREFLGHGSDK